MNRFIGLIITVVAIAALAGAAIGWRFPFLGQSRSANELGTAPGSRRIQPANTVQPANRTRTVPANQPTPQNLENEQTTAQNTTGNSGATTTQQEQAETDPPVSALW